MAQRISDGKTIEPSAEIAKLLIEAGADVNARDYLGQSPLEWAATHASPEIVTMLIKAGANVNAESRYGTVLGATKNVEIAKLLIEAGANTEGIAIEERIPLHCNKRSLEDEVSELSRRDRRTPCKWHFT